MKKILLLALMLLLNPAFAKTTHHHHHTAVTQNDGLEEQGSYTNVDGQQIHRPAHTKSGRQPSGATAKCGDGSYSFSTHHRGTCSHHGGVNEWL